MAMAARQRLAGRGLDARLRKAVRRPLPAMGNTCSQGENASTEQAGERARTM